MAYRSSTESDGRHRSGSKSSSESSQLTPLQDGFTPLSSSAPPGWGFNTSTVASISSIVPSGPLPSSSAVTSPLHTSIDTSTRNVRNDAIDAPFLASPLPLELPESVMGIGTQSTFTDGPLGNVAFNKAPGIMRRLSRGAASKLGRRGSLNSHDKRDHSSGPVIMRRRSDSKTSVSKDSALDSSVEEDDKPDPLKARCGPDRVSFGDEYRLSLDSTAGVAPRVDPLLQCGSLLTKVTKQRKKYKTFFLDVDTAKTRGTIERNIKFLSNLRAAGLRLFSPTPKDRRIGQSRRCI
ncbi:phosphoinositide-specific phospholipase C [Coccidioides immitis H538.4]|uniref:Phosphoinositide-specific phospholipase C n=1 Tax=Coccidioides immitis H538.4 TaxID=396776 RepID=A0A0J8RNJ7_COCIT|nr:phosphoinositide-specific phospholipase C [Coccidioides immitis H538.4]